MTRFDFAPLYRSSLGLDHPVRLPVPGAHRGGAAAGFPPYDIEMRDDGSQCLTLAVPGFDIESLAVEIHENRLTVTGRRDVDKGRPRNLRPTIAGRGFARSFELADHVRVAGAHLENGLLRIDLVRELPEEKQPRRIEIRRAAPRRLVQQVKTLVESVSRKAA